MEDVKRVLVAEPRDLFRRRVVQDIQGSFPSGQYPVVEQSTDFQQLHHQLNTKSFDLVLLGRGFLGELDMCKDGRLPIIQQARAIKHVVNGQRKFRHKDTSFMFLVDEGDIHEVSFTAIDRGADDAVTIALVELKNDTFRAKVRKWSKKQPDPGEVWSRLNPWHEEEGGLLKKLRENERLRESQKLPPRISTEDMRAFKRAVAVLSDVSDISIPVSYWSLVKYAPDILAVYDHPVLRGPMFELVGSAKAAHSIQVGIFALAYENGNGTGVKTLRPFAEGLVHDRGWLKLDTKMLPEVGKWDDGQVKEMQRHPVLGADDLCDRMPKLSVGAVREHHERYDGSGYPYHLRGGEITESGSRLGAADVFAAQVFTQARRPEKIEWDRALASLREPGLAGEPLFNQKHIDRFESIVRPMFEREK